MLFSEPEKNENFSENIESQDDIIEHTISALPCLPRCVYTHLNQILLTITNMANIYYGLIMMRLCTILTAMRKWEAKMTFTDVYCDDADFKTARGIVPNCIKHSLALFTMLPGGIKVTQPAKSNEEVFYILLAMPEEFTWSEFWAALKAAQFSKNICNKALKKFVKKGFIVKKEGKYIKNKKALKKVSKRA